MRALTPKSIFLLEKLIITQPVKKLLSDYGTRRFTTVFTATGPCPSQIHPVHNFPIYTMMYPKVSRLTESITKYTLTKINTR
jgi:hypothetical protein